jgi:hypothetical protein
VEKNAASSQAVTIANSVGTSLGTSGNEALMIAEEAKGDRYIRRFPRDYAPWVSPEEPLT